MPRVNKSESIEELPKLETDKSIDQTVAKINREKAVKLLPITNGFCPNCNQKIRTGLNREPICPIKLDGCERNL